MNSAKAVINVNRLAAIALFCAFDAAAQLQTFTFEQGVDGYVGTEDTFIALDFPNNSGGDTDLIFVGTTAGNTTTEPPARRGLLRFDLSSLPPGFIVTSVTLELGVELVAPGGAATMETAMHRLLTDWGEGTNVGPQGGGFGGPANDGDATWNSAFHNQVSWTTQGGDFDPTPSAMTTVQGENTLPQWTGDGLVADVQGWLDAPSTNFGWIFIAEGEGVDLRRIRGFGASEGSTDAPVLTITGGVPQEIVLEQGLDGYMGFEDTSIFEAFPDNSGGATDGIFSGTIRTPIRNSRALIRADLSALPTDTFVVDAALTLTVNKSAQTVDVIEYGIHPMTSDWAAGEVDGADNPLSSAGGAGFTANEGDATWNSAFHNQTAWTTPGGDFEATATTMASAAGSGDELTFSGVGLAEDVQAWIDDPVSNLGWIIVSTIEGTGQRIKEFHSSEAAADRPRLVLTVLGGTPPEDLDGNGSINSVDIQLVINAVLGNVQGGINPDVNNDSQVNAVDIQLVILAVLGL